MKRKLPFLLALSAIVYTSVSAQNTYPWPSNQNIGIGTTSPLAPLHVKNTAPLYGTITAQDAVRSGVQAQALNTFIGADGNRVAYFGPSWGNFVISNEASTNPTDNVVALSPFGVTTIGGFNNWGNTLQVHGTAYVRDNLGIGTANPNATLDANGTILSSNWINDAGVTITGDNGNYGSIQATNASNSDYKDLVLQEFAGSVAIGTNDAKGYKLAVNGDAVFTKIKVKQYGQWPDYVFRQNYKLPTLKEVEAFIKQNKHLPGLPSASRVEKDGIDIGENQAVLLKKIEELTLYLIELKKQVDTQNKILDQQQRKIAHPKKKLQKIKHG